MSTMDTSLLQQKVQRNAGALSPQQNFELSMGNWFKQNGKRICTLMKSQEEANRLLVAFMSACTRNDKIFQCAPDSFVTALMTCAQLRLYPGISEECALVPLSNGKNGRLELNWWPMYPGLVKLAYRSKLVRSVDAHVVFENEMFVYEAGDQPRIKHQPILNRQKRGDRICTYSCIPLTTGRTQMAVVPEEDIEAIKRRSPSFKAQNSPWKSEDAHVIDAMWKKTALKAACKYIPKDEDIVIALAWDEVADAGASKTGLVDVLMGDSPGLDYEPPRSTDPEPDA